MELLSCRWIADLVRWKDAHRCRRGLVSQGLPPRLLSRPIPAFEGGAALEHPLQIAQQGLAARLALPSDLESVQAQRFGDAASRMKCDGRQSTTRKK